MHSRCKHVSECGGCKAQQIAYAEQLQKKQQLVLQAFAPFLDNTAVHPILPCKDPWHYRNKMEFSFSQDRAGTHYLGLMLRGGRRRVFNLEECHLCAPWMASALQAARTWWKKSGLQAYHPPSDRGSLRTLTLRDSKRTHEKMAILTVSGNPDYALTRVQIEEFVAALDVPGLSVFVTIQQIKKGSPTQFFEMHVCGSTHITEHLEVTVKGKTERLTFKISPSSFFQPNPLQAELLYGRALELCTLSQGTEAFDLYCGTATLAMVLGKHVKKVVGIELNPHAVFDGRSNLALNGIENVEIHIGDVGKTLLQLCEKGPLASDLVVVDPPRAGLDATALSHLTSLKPKEILYISCNPFTQAENVKILIQAGYRLKHLQPVDQFPHTDHTENIALLA